MKPKSLSLILLLSSLGSITAIADTHIVSGVNLDNITESTTFYDNGKGYYWTWPQLSSRLESKYNANNKSYSFLGEWESYTTGAGGDYSTSQITGLTNDADTCWYNVSANLITYWQTVYGVFYTGTKPLQTGYTYDKSLLSDFGGTQSLQIGKLMYDNWQDEAGSLKMAASWYFCGDTSWSNLKTSADSAGYFKDYFGDSSTGNYHATVDYTFFGTRSGSGDLSASTMTLQSVTTAFSDAFGFTDDGEADAGKLGYLGISPFVNGDSIGHALTCYGYNTDENGVIQSLIVTNSDDLEYRTLELFLKIEQGNLYLYSDKELTERWKYAGTDWYIDELSFIETPEELKAMLEKYKDAANNQVWNGQLAQWNEEYDIQPDAETLPTEKTGWDVYVEEGDHSGYFHTYYDATRGISFDDHAGSNQSIAINGTVKAGTMNLSANTYNYEFHATNPDDKIIVSNLYKDGTADVEFSGMTVTSQGYTNISNGVLKLTNGAWLEGHMVEIQPHSTLLLDNGNVTSMTGVFNIYNKGALEIGAGGGKVNSSLTLKDGAELIFNLTNTNTDSAALTLSGNLTIEGIANFLFNEQDLVHEHQYMLIAFANGWESSDQINNITLGTGTLNYSDNILYYTYLKSTELTWDTLAEGTWSSNNWDGEAQSTHSANVTFGRDATVTVAGTVSPGKITINDGKSVTLLAGDNAAISGRRSVSVGEHAALNSQLALEGYSINLSNGSTLTYDLSTQNTISSIDMAEGSALVLAEQTGSTNTEHVISDANRLAGNINIQSGNNLSFALKENKEITGTITAAEGTNLSFTNSSSSQDITYTLATGTDMIDGTINVGGVADARGTTLCTTGASDAAFNLTEKGTLQLTGGTTDTPVAFTGTVEGNGTLLVDENASVHLNVSNNKTGLSNTTTLLVQGNATIGANGTWVSNGKGGIASGLSTAITNNIIVDAGSVNAWLDCSVSNSPLNMPNLTLDNGGSFNIKTSFSKYEGGKTIKATIEQLTIGEGGGKFGIYSDFRGSYYARPNAEVEINTLKGTGDVTIYGHSVYDAKTQVYKLGDTTAYTGDITVEAHTAGSLNINSLHITALEFSEDTTMNGSITVDGERYNSRSYTYYNNSYKLNDFQHRAMLGINADVSIGGLDGNDGAYLYAGALASTDVTRGTMVLVNDANETPLYAYADTATEAANVANAISKEHHTLTINSGADHNFAGIVMGGVSITKQGNGTQTFSGDVSRMDGSLSVQAGKLSFTAETALNIQNLSITAGATLQSPATIHVTGDAAFVAGTDIAALHRATSVSHTDLNLQGTATVDADLNLAMADSLTMGAVVDMMSNELTLSTTPITLNLMLNDAAPDTTFDLVLFTNVSQLNLGEAALDFGSRDANLFFTSDYITEDTTLVYANDYTISLHNLRVIPEPATATLSMLALAALAMRRRRK